MSCYSSTFRTHNPTSKTCPCISGYYSSGALLCLACTSPCLTCNGGSIINCTSCIAGYNLIGSSCNAVVSCPSSFNYEGHCVSSCPNTTYPSAGVCLSCSGYCLTCLSASVCSSCVSPFYLLTNGTCLGHCPTGTYASNGNCLTCPNGCTSCVFRSTMTQVNCLSCAPSYYIWGVVCSNSCPLAAQTHLIYENRCIPCISPCLTCTNLTSTGCLTCISNYILNNGKCLSSCPDGTYLVNSNCVACASNCVSCQNS